MNETTTVDQFLLCPDQYKLTVNADMKNYSIKHEYTVHIKLITPTLQYLMTVFGMSQHTTLLSWQWTIHLMIFLGATFVKLTSDFAAISMVHTFFSFLVFPWASSCRLVYFSSMSRRSCCLKKGQSSVIMQKKGYFCKQQHTQRVSLRVCHLIWHSSWHNPPICLSLGPALRGQLRVTPRKGPTGFFFLIFCKYSEWHYTTQASKTSH